MRLIGKIFKNLNRAGWRKVRLRAEEFDENRRYQKWIRRIEKNSAEQRRMTVEQSRSLPHQPLISIVLPVYNVEEKWLRRCLESVEKQIYENWELCIADDCSPSPHVKRVLNEYAARDRRIKIVFRSVNGHISAASNSALESASGEFCALLDHDDELSDDALFHIAKEINESPEANLIYSDEDMIDESGRRYQPKFKPDWSRDLFYSLNLITHLAAYRTEILREIGGWRAGFEGSQDYDLSLRFIELIAENTIRHIPRILYHWRAISGSVALHGDEKPYAHERARRAIAEHLERTGKQARVSAAFQNLHRVQYDLPAAPPKVNLIMLAESASATGAIKTLLDATDYQNLEIVAVCSAEAELDAEFARGKVKIIVCEEASAAEKYNLAVSQTSGEMLCFINENLCPASGGWLKELVGFARQKEIGAAGAKLTNADGKILHGGIVFGAGDLIGIAHRNLPKELSGNLERAQVVGNYSATAIDCLATRRDVFEAVGKFDAGHFPNRLFDADFCLKIGERNLRVVWTPYAELFKAERRKLLSFEKNSTAAERDFFKRKWRGVIERDPFYNPSFSRRKRPFAIDA